MQFLEITFCLLFRNSKSNKMYKGSNLSLINSLTTSFQWILVSLAVTRLSMTPASHFPEIFMSFLRRNTKFSAKIVFSFDLDSWHFDWTRKTADGKNLLPYLLFVIRLWSSQNIYFSEWDFAFGVCWWEQKVKYQQHHNITTLFPASFPEIFLFWRCIIAKTCCL